QAVSGVMASVILLPALLVGITFDIPLLEFKNPTGYEMVLLVGIALFGTVGHLLMTWSLKYAPAATLAPMQYLEIPVATFIGWLIFSDLPNFVASIGIAIIMAAGLYIVMRERVVARQSALRPELTGPAQSPA
ncbi:MAG: EamA family transporter, partial [Paracoccaceae bacterium]